MVQGKKISRGKEKVFRMINGDHYATADTSGILSQTVKAMQPLRQSTPNHFVCGTKRNVKNHNEHQHIFFDGATKKASKAYPPTTILPSGLKPFNHFKNHPINRTIARVNEVVFVLFKQKVKIEPNQVIPLLKYFQVPVPKVNGISLDLAECKKPDFLNSVNFALLQRLYKDLNQENGNVQPEQSSCSFRFHVGSGNNYQGVR